MDILVATREASRSAHRWRDAAAAFYESNQHGFAGHASRKKSAMYVLKEKGIAHLHRSGAARYAGVSPQGMGLMSTATAVKPACTLGFIRRALVASRSRNVPRSCSFPRRGSGSR